MTSSMNCTPKSLLQIVILSLMIVMMYCVCPEAEEVAITKSRLQPHTAPSVGCAQLEEHSQLKLRVAGSNPAGIN